MNEQPEAKKAPLIERLEAVPAYARLTIHDGHYSTSYYPVGAMAHEAAAELRRLHEVNTELLEALNWIAAHDLRGADLKAGGWMAYGLVHKARAAINKAREPKP